MEEIIRAAILLDTVTTSPVDIYTDNPDAYIDANSVPTHLSSCLSEMFSAMIPASGSFSDVVTISRGDGSNRTTGIIIEPAIYFDREKCADDSPEYEEAQFSILVKLTKTSNNPNLMKAIGRRLRYILDNYARSISGNTYMANRSQQDMDTSIDPTIRNPRRGGYFKVFWINSAAKDNSEWLHTFLCKYTINFGDYG